MPSCKATISHLSDWKLMPVLHSVCSKITGLLHFSSCLAYSASAIFIISAVSLHIAVNNTGLLCFAAELGLLEWINAFNPCTACVVWLVVDYS